MRRFVTWAALMALVLGLVLTVGCQQAQQEQPAQDTGGMAEEAGTTMEAAGDSMHQTEAGDSMHQMEAGDVMEQEAGEATGTN